MWRIRTLAILAAGCLMVAGCSELAYKRGAGAGELDDAQKICKSHDVDKTAYEKCMDERGWVVHKLDELSPVATIIPNRDNKTSGLEQEAHEKGDAATKQMPPNPLDIYTISSWWKMGGKPEELQLTVDACVKKLGEAHRPPSGSLQATRGLLLCLREQGWHGLQGK